MRYGIAVVVVVNHHLLTFFTMFNIELSSSVEVAQAEEVVVDNYYDSDAVSHSDEQKASDLHNIFEQMEQKMTQEAEQRAQDENKVFKVPRMIRNVLILGGFLLGAMVWWVSLTSLINLFRRDFKPRHLIMINRIAGIIISALGVYTLISVIINL